MRVIFMGSPKFASDILEELVHVQDVVCVFSQPDKVRSRGNKTTPTPVKETAEKLGLEVLTPKTLNDEDVVAHIASLSPDAICVAAYGALLPKAVLDIPKYGCFNVHASLLPRWRGAAPIERAILSGDEYAGICIMRMEEGLDTGDYCISRSIPIGDMSADELRDELANLGAVALITALEQAEMGALRWSEQDEASATYANRIEKRELYLNPALSAIENMRHVRASCPSYPAKATIGDRTISVIKAHVNDDPCEPSEGIATARSGCIALGCDQGSIVLDIVKPDGKNEMAASDFLAGFRPIQEMDLDWR